MITETKEVYKCEHCRKLYQIKSAAIKHEIRCKKNPENFRACFMCKYSIKKEVTIYEDAYNGEIEFKKELLYCEHFNKFLIPPLAKHKGNYYETDPIPNEDMPRECLNRVEHGY